jgi:hypothetical protein
MLSGNNFFVATHWSRNVISEPLLSNGRLLRLHHSSLQLSCRNIFKSEEYYFLGCDTMSLAEVTQYWLHFQFWTVNRASRKEANQGRMFLLNISKILVDYTISHLRRFSLPSYFHENLIFSNSLVNILSLSFSLALLPSCWGKKKTGAGLWDNDAVCVSVNLPYQILNAWTNLYETWHVHHGTWAHLNVVLHKFLPSVSVSECVSPYCC